MKKHRIALAFALILLPSAYTAQATMKLKRTLGPGTSLSVHRFSLYMERLQLGALSVPMPLISYQMDAPLWQSGEVVWSPSRNAWVPSGRAVLQGC